jgi:hypothetical protein
MKKSAALPQSRALVIKDVFGEDTDLVFQVISTDNSHFQKRAMEFGQRMMRNPDSISLAESDTFNAESYAACITGWTGWEDDDGNPIPYSHAEALAIMTNPGLSWVRKQVEGYVMKRTNFFRPSAVKSDGVGDAERQA